MNIFEQHVVPSARFASIVHPEEFFVEVNQMLSGETKIISDFKNEIKRYKAKWLPWPSDDIYFPAHLASKEEFISNVQNNINTIFFKDATSQGNSFHFLSEIMGYFSTLEIKIDEIFIEEKEIGVPHASDFYIQKIKLINEVKTKINEVFQRLELNSKK